MPADSMVKRDAEPSALFSAGRDFCAIFAGIKTG
jgi:hypothetical protein